LPEDPEFEEVFDYFDQPDYSREIGETLEPQSMSFVEFTLYLEHELIEFYLILRVETPWLGLALIVCALIWTIQQLVGKLKPPSFPTTSGISD
jgi:hypothetical protein